MAWFSDTFTFEQTTLNIAHISDCHLFADTQGEYFGVNTAHYLEQTVADIATKNVDLVIFGGDLTQDHSMQSYQLFYDIVDKSELNCPVFWLPGNHDELALLTQISTGKIHPAKLIKAQGMQLLLTNSKGNTPAGWVTPEHIEQICTLDSKLPSVVFCHHNPLPINGYLDKHMLENGPQFLNTLVNEVNALAVFHGHVHQQNHDLFRALDIYATPATSVQFKRHSRHWLQEDLGPAYRMISLDSSKNDVILDTKIIWLKE
ncbi:metallophosphoesterase [Pseudoalteromonas sp. MMG010]|uniref:metallophosphoesterase n=1 Tax=Pseudoalteromonas sp. MMG010 TaxID=2822685 RepID=UPI001B39F3E5|nr:metallophosphoesterase [Pseudoalteromonas sp. MMG010]MBQ4832837.1 metallophosphoesterase [Pseudoalteromonas sp. MMG010]